MSNRRKDYTRTLRTVVGTMLVGRELRRDSVGIELHVDKQIGFKPPAIEGAPPQAIVMNLNYRAFYPWVNVAEMQYGDVTKTEQTSEGPDSGES